MPLIFFLWLYKLSEIYFPSLSTTLPMRVVCVSQRRCQTAGSRGQDRRQLIGVVTKATSVTAGGRIHIRYSCRRLRTSVLAREIAPSSNAASQTLALKRFVNFGLYRYCQVWPFCFLCISLWLFLQSFDITEPNQFLFITGNTFCRTRSLSNATFSFFDHVTFIQFKICCCVQTFMKIGWFFTEIWRYINFQNGGCPPSWNCFTTMQDHPRSLWQQLPVKFYVNLIHRSEDIAIWIFRIFG